MPQGSGQSGFSPKSTAPAVWMRSDKGVTLSSGKLTAIADQSGNGFSGTAGGAGCQYTASDAAFNGHPSVGGASNTVAITIGAKPNTILSGATAAEMFVVITSVNEAATFSNGWGFNNSAGNGEIIAFVSGAVFDDFCGKSSGGETRFTWTPAAGLGAPMIYNVISTSSNWVANINGTQSFSATGASLTNTFTLGSSSNLVFGNGKKVWAEILVWPRQLSTAERGNIKNYLAARYAITAS